MKNKKHILVILFFVLLLSACGGSNTTAQIEGHTWVLTNFNDSQPIPGHQPTLQFDDGQVSGTTGCNHYGGSYKVKGDAIQFEGIFSTEMACLDPDGLMDQERIYLELLGAADRYEMSEDLLKFFIESQLILIFSKKDSIGSLPYPALLM